MKRTKSSIKIKPIKTKLPFFGRSFSQKRISQWLKADRLTAKEQKEIDALIDRLP